MRTFQEGATMQVAMVVRDMDAAMKRHWDVFKIGPWDIYTFDATKVRDYTYRGKPATHSCLIAVAWSGDTQLELMQPLTGYSIYDEHLEQRGEGLHHIKLYYKDCKKAVADFTGPRLSRDPERPVRRRRTLLSRYAKGLWLHHRARERRANTARRAPLSRVTFATGASSAGRFALVVVSLAR